MHPTAQLSPSAQDEAVQRVVHNDELTPGDRAVAILVIAWRNSSFLQSRPLDQTSKLSEQEASGLLLRLMNGTVSYIIVLHEVYV